MKSKYGRNKGIFVFIYNVGFYSFGGTSCKANKFESEEYFCFLLI